MSSTAANGEPQQVVAADQRAYVATDSNVEIYDVSDPQKPFLLCPGMPINRPLVRENLSRFQENICF